MLNAGNDVFAFTEAHLAGDPAFNVFYGGVFEANGGAADTDSEGDIFEITHIDGQPVSATLLFHSVTMNSGADFLLVAENGNFAFYFFDSYDWLPAGQTATEEFTYTIADSNGETATASVTLTITGVDSNDRFTGTSGRNVIDAGIGADFVSGGGGDDIIYGGRGEDTIFGGAGIDRITGGLGADYMVGGTQRDIFDFNAVNEIGKTVFQRDVIRDFKAGLDDIDLRTIDANSRIAGNQNFTFIGQEGFHRVAGELRFLRNDFSYNPLDTTVVMGDINGDGKADFELLLSGLKMLKATDFIL